MAAIAVPPDQAAQALPRKRFSREEVDEMLQAGLFAGERYELIDGDLIDKMGQNPPHGAAIVKIQKWLATFVDIGRIRIQLSMEAAREDRKWTIPEPDLAVVAEEKADYEQRHPRGDEMLLVIEVSDTTVKFDLTRKAVLYARAGVPEYWVLNLPRRQLVVHRQPDGVEYRSIRIHSEEETVSMEGLDRTVKVGELLPRPEAAG
jgi:Uma2 family endonuclease